uniref:BMA-DHS-20 n=1 Tax=Brugia malayi TaxID=6279 RepID=A0A0H5S290_BRUMA|nr:BMA-DHS-20 [Brugia malayi]
MLLQVLLLIAALIFLYYGIRNYLETIQIANLNSKAVFISGCDSGFGYLLAIKCAKNGLPTFAGCLTEEGMQTIREEAKKTIGMLIPVQIDVTKEDSVQNAVRFVQENLDSKLKLWALVNNAGSFGIYGYDDWCKIEEYEKDLSVNTLGVIRVTHAFLSLLKQSRGRVITITSICGRLALPGIGPYTVSKFATEAYINVLRQEMREFGVQCIILEPGRFRTGLMDKKAMIDRISRVWNRLDNAKKAEYGGEAFKELYCERSCEFFNDGASTSLNLVIDSYYHAITGNFPRCHYCPGLDSIYLLLLLLPTNIRDFLICDLYSFITGWPPKVIPSTFNLINGYFLLKHTIADWFMKKIKGNEIIS